MDNKPNKCLNCGHNEFYKSSMIYKYIEPNVNPVEINEKHIHVKHHNFNKFINVYACKKCGFVMNFVNIN